MSYCIIDAVVRHPKVVKSVPCFDCIQTEQELQKVHEAQEYSMQTEARKLQQVADDRLYAQRLALEEAQNSWLPPGTKGIYTYTLKLALQLLSHTQASFTALVTHSS